MGHKRTHNQFGNSKPMVIFDGCRILRIDTEDDRKIRPQPPALASELLAGHVGQYLIHDQQIKGRSDLFASPDVLRKVPH